MRTNTPIIIPIFIYTEEEVKLKKLDLEAEDSGFKETVKRAFYSIDSVYIFDDEKDYGAFYSGGTSFVSPMSMLELIDLIDNHNRK